MNKLIKIAIALCGLWICGSATSVFAQESRQHYEQPTIAKYSQLYWAISKMDPMNDSHIDNFLMINECDIYRDYGHNEFEWKEIREAARDFVVQNKKNFPLRFEFMQPVYLKDYNFDRGGFEVNDEYKILGTRRFEMGALDYNEEICGQRNRIPDYPKILILELSRPFNLEFINVDEKLAEEYIAMKAEEFQALDTRYQTQKKLYELRDVYIVLKVKVYAYKGPDRTAEGQDVAVVLAVLESFEVYADRDRNFLMYSENFRTRTRVSKSEQNGVQGASVSHHGGAPERPEEGMLLD